MSEQTGIPLIDISPWKSADPAARAALAREIDAACCEWGFLIISGHGVERELMQAMKDVSYAFFDLPIDERARYASRDPFSRRGYQGFATGANARVLGQILPPDLREAYRAGPEPISGDPYYASPEALRFFRANVWPDVPASMRDIWERYYRAMDDLADRLMQMFAQALDLPHDWFRDKIDRAISQLVAQHYPQLQTAPLPGQLRNGEHTDFGNITLLMTEDRPGGLQVLGTDRQWHDVVPVAGTFIVNLGDMLAQWTNDRWRSTLHRVVNPPAERMSDARRLSVVFFHQPNIEAVIDTIPSCITRERPKHYDPVGAGEFFATKLEQVHNLSSPPAAAREASRPGSE